MLPLPLRTLPLRITPLRTLHPLSPTHLRTAHIAPGTPTLFPLSQLCAPLPLSQKWFVPREPPHLGLQLSPYLTASPSHASFSVNLERTTPGGFTSALAPFSLFNTWAAAALSSTPPNSQDQLYIAQTPLISLPPSLAADIPTPPLLSEVGKGDVYGSSLWLGIPPTRTPLHRDPNPNLLVQIAGRKVVRLLAPHVGDWVHAAVFGGRGRVRGNLMGEGKEGEGVEGWIWGAWKEQGGDGGWDGVVEGFEAQLEAGDALYIPLGWWHSVRGVGEGINASVNWWFR
ncbi:Clavaminate synthase-like protein [Trichodelitschia bisporula]|uniref:Clavaminate synthase-like protein n=1 Tax=Trichodelitschia bisporula TaxID=703511 RepID=A0A6G1HZ56_9PEZI|nr:Clavaminate synthase-like protein [Trichodelitschia bisporula]